MAIGTSYAAILLLLTLGPLGWWLNRLTVRVYVVVRFDLGLTWLPLEPEHVGFALNVLLFVPVGALLAFALSGSWRAAAATAVTLSAGIEVVQLVPVLDRTADWLDVVANGLGAMMGAWSIHRFRHGPQAPTPSRSRG
ncbi:hypothetical protein GCM10027425_02950 [Alteromonas gracilis]